MNIKPIKTAKTLTPNEENVKELLEELLRLYVNMPKSAKLQKKIVGNVIDRLKNQTVTFQQLFEMLLFIMKMVKSKESIAIISRLFNKFQQTYKNTLKEKP